MTEELKEEISGDLNYPFDNIAGLSPEMQKAYQRIVERAGKKGRLTAKLLRSLQTEAKKQARISNESAGEKYIPK